MKTIFSFIIFSSLSLQNSFAGYMYLNCEAYRVSNDTNQNIQILKIKQEGVSINGSADLEVIQGDTMALPITDTVLKATDGNGDFDLNVTVIENITEAYGRKSIGRYHDMVVDKVLIKASRNSKTHEFIGTCTSEVLTTCGGECGPESIIKDEL